MAMFRNTFTLHALEILFLLIRILFPIPFSLKNKIRNLKKN